MDIINIILVILVLSYKVNYCNSKGSICLSEQVESGSEEAFKGKVNGKLKREVYVKEGERRWKARLESQVHGEGLREIFENGIDISKTSRELAWIMRKLAEEIVEHEQSMVEVDHVSQLMRKEGNFRTNILTNESWDSKMFNHTQSGCTDLVERNQYGGNQKQMECRHRKECLQSIDD